MSERALENDFGVNKNTHSVLDIPIHALKRIFKGDFFKFCIEKCFFSVP